MCRNYLLIAVVMVICSRYTCSDPVSCYQCSGVTCEPEEEFLQPCDNQLKRTVARCFSVAWNLTNIYRGCYEQGDPFLQHCIDTRLSRCAVCEGFGCNSQPLFQPASALSCRHCAYGLCNDENSTRFRNDFHTCNRFLMTVVPSCYSILDYAMVSFTFGCTNDLAAHDFHLCSLDRLQLTCRLCYTMNCNNFAHEFNGYSGNRKRCLSSITAYSNLRYCDRYSIHTPFVHCFLEVNFMRPRLQQFTGCTSSYPPSEIKQVVQGINYFNCWPADCNNLYDLRAHIQYNQYRPCIDTTEPHNVTFGSVMDSCCAVSEYKDEYDRVQQFSGCETKLNCLLPQLCRRCCDDQRSFLRGDKVTCNLEPHKFTHQCYRCDNCLLVSDVVLGNRTNCMAEPGEIRSCYIYRKDNLLFRGCYYKNPYMLNVGLYTCHEDPQNCQVCQGNLCNVAEMVSYCYQCSERNHNCQYDQQLVGHLQYCTSYNFSAPFDFHSNPGCYTISHWDGTVKRGCGTRDFQCPPTAKCKTCTGLGCNYRGHIDGYCLRCFGDQSSICARLPTGEDQWGSTIAKCAISFDKPLCYAFWDGRRGSVQRGCTIGSIYTEAFRHRCETEENSTCLECNTNHCNYWTKPVLDSDARSVAVSSLLLTVIFVILNLFVFR